MNNDSEFSKIKKYIIDKYHVKCLDLSNKMTPDNYADYNDMVNNDHYIALIMKKEY